MPGRARHADRRERRPILFYVCAVVAVVAMIGGGAAVLRGGVDATSASTGCAASQTHLTVAASPDIASVVATVARRARDLRSVAGCEAVTVEAESATSVIDGLVHGQSAPDVWIPDSSLWINRARSDQLEVPGQVQSVASSPLVFAVQRAVDDRLSSTADGATPRSLVLGSLTVPTVLHLFGPASSPETVGAVSAMQRSVAADPQGRAALAALLRAAALDPTPESSAASLATLTGGARDAAVGSARSVVVVPEQTVWAHDASTSHAISAIYQSTGTPFDYPDAVLTDDPAKAMAAGLLLSALRGDDGQRLIRAAGFRGVDGRGTGLTASRGVDGSEPSVVAIPDSASVSSAVDTLATMRKASRVLAVLDVSGSMAWPAPGYPDTTRLALATGAAGAGLSLYPDGTDVGLWAFSMNMTPTSDYRQLIAMSPLSSQSQRQAAASALASLRPVPDGGTALYDTTLAAARAVQHDWDPARVNSVVLLSDGQNTDPRGTSLDELLRDLKTERAGARPVPVITIAYGPDSDAQVLAAISRASGGAAYRTTDADGIREVFLDAIGQRACRPQCTAP